MFTVDLNKLFESTSATVRATVVVVLTCGAVALAIAFLIVLSIPIIKGQEFHAWIIDLKEYKDPRVAACTEATNALRSVYILDQDNIKSYDSQIGELERKRANDLERFSAVGHTAVDRPNVKFVAEEWKIGSVAATEEIDRLRKLQQEIAIARADVAKNWSKACDVR